MSDEIEPSGAQIRSRKGPSRRQLTGWMMAALMAPAYSSCSDPDVATVPDPSEAGLAPWLNLPVRTTRARGYGVYPNMVAPERPWPLTLRQNEKSTLRVLVDFFLPEDELGPAASDLGVVDFFDEWVSAPYTAQRRDANLILSGLTWMEDESERRFGRTFGALKDSQRSDFIREINEASLAPEQAPHGLGKPALFMRRVKYLAVGAYYTTEVGNEMLGYVGNTAIAGDWPGPSDEALEHLEAELLKIGLAMPKEQERWRNG